MVFSSVIFLYYFLPITIIVYFILPNKFKNFWLFLVSVFFYFVGETKYVLLLLFSCLFNYYSGKLIENKSKRVKNILLAFNLVVNFGLLFYFKYFNFFIDNINNIFNTNLSWHLIVLPIGISFFTFQAVSYVIDIYRGKIKSADNVFTFSTYLALFPQLIAGPVVRYETIEEELKSRKVNCNIFSDGVKRFIIGLSKKVLLANVLGELVRDLSLLINQSIVSYWVQAIANMLQIYLDFSGYSDMAIGLGLMFGFEFLENFNYPFISKSVTEFWRRWHISLSSWFKDYLYIPLGGSRCGSLKQYRNILVVWFATGLWHGASWNFVLWGLFFAVVLILEKVFLLRYLNRNKIVSHVYTLLVVLISFIIFSHEVSELPHFFASMFSGNDFINVETLFYLKNYVVVLVLSILCSTPVFKLLKEKLCDNKNIKKLFNYDFLFYLVLLVICTAFIIDDSFNPFLYFRF